VAAAEQILMQNQAVKTGRPPATLFLALLAAVCPVGMHIFVPALPLIARDLNITVAETQLVLTFYIMGMAGGQLIYGPLSDRFGRRPMVLAGLVVFTLSMAAALFVTHAGLFIGLRLFQALGGAGGLVLGRAIVRDASANDRAVGQLAVLSFTLSASISVAPALGGFWTAWFGWRALFIILASLGALSVVIAWFRLPETHHNRLDTNGFQTLARGFVQLLPMRVFTGHAIGGATACMAIYGFVAASPFLFVDVLHRPIEEVGTYYILLLGGVMVGAGIANRLSGKVHANLLARIGASVSLLASIAMLVADQTGNLSVFTLVAPMVVFNICLGIIGPNATMGAISADPKLIGAASGIYGFMQMGYGAFCSFIVGFWHTSGATPVALLMTISVAIGLTALWVARPLKPAS
jgi:DHA1 family bicyclomycin/chloramphenicol resistance-like MFS transporter